MTSCLITTVLVLISSGPLDPVTARLESAGFLLGNFVQIDTWALTLESETSAGRLYLASPDLFLLEYSDPPGKKTGFDGENIYTIDPLFEQVILYPGSEPGSFLHMLDRCSDSTTVAELETVGDTVTVNLSGDLGEGITAMVVGYTLPDSLPWLFVTTDLNGNSTSYTFDGIEIEHSWPEGFFSLEIPHGYELVNSGDI